MPWLVLTVLVTGAALAQFAVFAINVAVPAIQRGLHASDAAIQLVVAGYSLTYAIFLITGGRLGDQYGRRRLYLVGLTVFTAAVLGAAVAPDAGWLIALRLLQGIGAAAMFPQLFALLVDTVPKERQATAFGFLGAAIGSAAVIGQLIGGLLVHANLAGTTWRPVFGLVALVGVGLLIVAPLALPASPTGTARSIDLLGTVLLTVVLLLVVVPLIEGGDHGWPPWVWVCLVAALPVLTIFGSHERRLARRGGDPLVEPGLLRDRAFAVGVLLMLAVYALFASTYLALAVTWQRGLGYSALDAGVGFLPLGLALLLASLVAPRFVARHGRPVLIAGAVVAIAGLVWAAALSTGPHPPDAVALILPLILQGVGEGFLFSPLLAEILGRVRPAIAATAAGVMSTGQQVGGALGIALLGVVFFGHLHEGHGADAGTAHADAFRTSMLLGAGISVLMVAMLFALPRRRAAERGEEGR
ncbi:MFS transporter [Pseudonocardia acaciae]|uniref:MFS transporter n=1 Tax=Pseudonocardia acaciae TaxID=551276 RepID=UPI00056886C2|nr:MFS transporter [Pseudonocardia acaciae]